MQNVVMAVGSNTNWLEQANWISQIILVLVAMGTFEYARRQVAGAAQDRSQQLKISQATLLLELDARWDSEEIKEARSILVDMVGQTKQAVTQANPMAADGAKEQHLKAAWKAQLQTMRTASDGKYFKMLSMCGFFESVGLMVERGYISLDDVLALFKGPLVDLHMVFAEHIADRENEMGVPKGLFEHALNLATRAKVS